jgi:hypothetical protein
LPAEARDANRPIERRTETAERMRVFMEGFDSIGLSTVTDAMVFAKPFAIFEEKTT